MAVNKNVVTWDSSDKSSKANAMAAFSDAMESYEGIGKSTGGVGSRYRDFLDIEPNRTVRPGFTNLDYYAFRSEEQVPTKKKKIIKACMDAYNKVGIIKNIIDLMGDFGSQGINIVHENKSVEDFYQQWFRKINGKERSERFLNNFYRTGHAFIYRSMAVVTPEISRYIKSMGEDIRIKLEDVKQNLIPWRYNFLNPLAIDLKDGEYNLFIGKRKYELDTSKFIDNLKKNNVQPFETLPPEVKNAINSNKKIELDTDKLVVYFYKKDDWEEWANPMIYSILDDVIMLEKMRLADLSALDGAISNIRLWTLGDLEHQILPTRAGIDKLRNILASNVGGGTMELVWGPELKYTESNSQVYKFLGSEKYTSVLNSIYAGLGVPPTLTGMANNGGGFTNNFISLKTLIERLQYGRDQLTKFWENEVEIIRKAMGFRKAPHIVFDQMSLSDESSEKALLIQLADRDIISHETVLERFNEVPSVEKVRLMREGKDRVDDKLPEKVSPFIKPVSQIPGLGFDPPQSNPQGGRPISKKDTKPRKKRVDTPRSKPGLANLVFWSQNTFDKVSASINSSFLKHVKKANLRQLTKDEAFLLEDMKVVAFSNLEIMSDVDDNSISKALVAQRENDFTKYLSSKGVSLDTMTMDDYKKKVVSTYVEFVSENGH